MLHPNASGRGARGFTLVELMTTVAIVGVLAVVAYAGYHKFVVSSHQTEANAILSGIKNRQEAYKAETGSYLNVSGTVAGNQGTGSFVPTGFTTTSAGVLYPHCAAAAAPAPGAFSVTWPVTACPTTCCPASTPSTLPPSGDWLKLKMESTAPTFYGFTTMAGAAGTSPLTTVPLTVNGNVPNWPAASLTSIPWFIATAVGDADGNGVFSTVMISSFDNEVYVDSDGE